MARTLELKAEPRTAFGKQVRHLRRAGIVPANIYGHGESLAIQTNERDLDHVLAQGGHGTILTVDVSEQGQKMTLVKLVQRHPKTARVLHVDLQAVNLAQVITAPVALRFVGEAAAVRAYGGVVMHQLTEIHVSAAAGDLPQQIEVDLSPLAELQSTIKIGDLNLPNGVTATDPPEEVVAMVLPPVGAAEAEEGPTGEAAGPTAESRSEEES